MTSRRGPSGGGHPKSGQNRPHRKARSWTKLDANATAAAELICAIRSWPRRARPGRLRTSKFISVVLVFVVGIEFRPIPSSERAALGHALWATHLWGPRARSSDPPLCVQSCPVCKGAPQARPVHVSSACRVPSVRGPSAGPSQISAPPDMSSACCPFEPQAALKKEQEEAEAKVAQLISEEEASFQARLGAFHPRPT